VRTSPRSFSRSWLPQANFDELMIRADRDPIHMHPALHHLHHRWNMDDVLPATAPAAEPAAGRGPKAWLRRYVTSVVREEVPRIVREELDRYFVEEKSFRAAVAQSVDAVAYRIDEVASADMKALLSAVRDDLLDLARFVDGRIESGGSR
jgi:uncharacterized phage protein gp47/JayE